MAKEFQKRVNGKNIRYLYNKYKKPFLKIQIEKCYN